MYEKNPRQEWTPAFDWKFSLKPWQMQDLTPFELEAYAAAAEQLLGKPETPFG